MKTTEPLATLVRIGRSWCVEKGPDATLERVTESRGDAVLLEWGPQARGLYTVLDAAARAQRIVFPARWFPARPRFEGGFADEGRILWMARGDASLSRLLSEEELDPAWMSSTPRPDEPVALLGVEGDVVTAPHAVDLLELRRRAEVWIHKLGRDRVALAIPWFAAAEHPLRELATQTSVPVVLLVDAQDPVAEELPTGTLLTPLLWTDFQLDSEHRLPDAGYVPGLRDLLHRGSLLRERTLYERLPAVWRTRADAELRALYGWHVNPLLRRAGALLQTLLPIEGVTVEAPLPDLTGVCAYLLGLTDRSPHEGGDAGQDARALAAALHEWKRRIVARIEAAAWPHLRGRLLSWGDGGLLAACPDEATESGARFCFSGQPLWTRIPLQPRPDGLARVDLDAADRRALGWFEIEVRGEAVARSSAGSSPRSSQGETASHMSTRARSSRASSAAPNVNEGGAAITAWPLGVANAEEQLPLDLEGPGA
jgi:hypothetical protein